jgi:hypothetical protein
VFPFAQKTDPEFTESVLCKYVMYPVSLSFAGTVAYAICAMLGVGSKPYDTGVLDYLVAPPELYGIFLVCVACYKIFNKFFGDSKKSEGGDKEHIRGHKIVSEAEVIKQCRSPAITGFFGEVGLLSIGKVFLNKKLEVLAILFAGGKGSGKSVAIKQLLQQIRKRGDRAIVLDSGGLLMQKNWKDGDINLNPMDTRCTDWSLFAEIRDPKMDLKSIAKSFIPDSSGDDKTWSSFAQTFAAGIMSQMLNAGQFTNKELFHNLVIATAEEIEAMLKGTAAARLASADAKGMAASVFGSAIALSEQIDHLNPDAGKNAFSIRKWVREGDKTGDTSFIWIPYTDNSIEATKGLIAAQLDIACREICSLTESDDRRIWVIADEVASVGKIGALPSYLQNSRKYGGGFIGGLQSLSQWYDLFGRATTTAMLSNIGNVMTLRVTDAETAEHMSKTLGVREVKQTMVSKTEAENNSSTTNYQYKEERIVLASEIQNLNPCVGVLNLAGKIDACWVHLPFPENLPDVIEPFMFKDWQVESKVIEAVLDPSKFLKEQSVEAAESAAVKKINPFEMMP